MKPLLKFREVQTSSTALSITLNKEALEDPEVLSKFDVMYERGNIVYIHYDSLDEELIERFMVNLPYIVKAMVGASDTPNILSLEPGSRKGELTAVLDPYSAPVLLVVYPERRFNCGYACPWCYAHPEGQRLDVEPDNGGIRRIDLLHACASIKRIRILAERNVPISVVLGGNADPALMRDALWFYKVVASAKEFLESSSFVIIKLGMSTSAYVVRPVSDMMKLYNLISAFDGAIAFTFLNERLAKLHPALNGISYGRYLEMVADHLESFEGEKLLTIIMDGAVDAVDVTRCIYELVELCKISTISDIDILLLYPYSTPKWKWREPSITWYQTFVRSLINLWPTSIHDEFISIDVCTLEHLFGVKGVCKRVLAACSFIRLYLDDMGVEVVSKCPREHSEH